MTATPLRTDGQNMIEKRCGKVAYELKLSDAVAREILKLPIYITSRYIFEEDIKNIEAKLELIEDEKVRQKLERKLRKAKKQLENAEGLKDILSKHLEKNGKYLAFCNPGDNLDSIIEKAKEEDWFDEINENQTFLVVESSRKDAENAMALRVFEKSKGKDLRILFSKNMLNEGIHDEEITGEIMMRPTRSYILFIQQLGRILSKDREDFPMVLDLVDNIHYFKEFRLGIQRIIREAEARGDKRYDAKVLEQFRIIEEQEDFIRAFEEIENSIEGYLNRTSISKTLEIARILNSNGVNLRKIQLTKTQDGKHIPILLKEIEQEGIDIGKIIEEKGLDGEFKYGEMIHGLRQADKGYGSRKITEEERKEARKLGLITKERGRFSQTLEIARILKANGVDLSRLQLTEFRDGRVVKLRLKEIKQDGVDVGKIIAENGIDGEFRYGENVSQLRCAYRGTSRAKITDEEKEEVRRLGIIKEKRRWVIQALEILRILKANGVDLSKTQITKGQKGKQVPILLGDIKQDGIDIQKIITENGLDTEYEYGKNVKKLRSAYKGYGTCAITEEEKEEVRKLGLISEKTKSVVAETLEIARILKANGVDLSKVQLTRRQHGKSESILLKEIKQEGIDIEKIIEENGLDGNFEYGKKIIILRTTYNGKGSYKITAQEKEGVEQLGIIPWETKSIVAQTLEVGRILKANGVDLSKIQLKRRQNEKYVPILLGEIEQEGIDIGKIIEENGLDRNFAYGRNVTSLRQAYTGVQKYRITKQEKEESRQLGLLGKIIGQDIGKASFDAPIEKCDEAQAVLDSLVQREGENEKSE